jgi:hypothetical protein
MKLSLLSAAAERVQTHNSAQCKQPFWLLIRVFILYCHIKNMSRKTYECAGAGVNCPFYCSLI